MKLVKTHPIKKPKQLKESDKKKISNILKSYKNYLSQEDLRIYKKELADG